MRYIILLFGFWSVTSLAAELRAFGIGTDIKKAEEMNSMLVGQNLKELKQLPGWGAEINGEPIARIHFGIRYEQYHLHLGDGTGTTLQPDPGFSELHAEMYQFIFRWALIDGSPVRFDIFGGAGGVKAMLKTKTNGGTEYEQGLRPDDMRFMQSAGVSLALGTNNFKVFFEGGVHWATVPRLYRDPGTPYPIDMIDMNGPFAAIGIQFNGTPTKGK